MKNMSLGRRILRQAVQSLQLITLSLLASACGTSSSGPLFLPAADTPENYSVHAYYNWLDSADTEEIDTERVRLESEERDLTRDVQLALVYSVPETASIEQEQQAIELLSTLEPPGGVRFGVRGAYSDFARIWRDVLQQRQALRNTETELVEALKIQNRQLQEESRRLQEQIDALTTIEQQLIEREQSQGR